MSSLAETSLILEYSDSYFKNWRYLLRNFLMLVKVITVTT